MKRHIYIVAALVVVMFVFAAAGCGNKDDSKQPGNSQNVGTSGIVEKQQQATQMVEASQDNKKDNEPNVNGEKDLAIQSSPNIKPRQVPVSSVAKKATLWITKDYGETCLEAKNTTINEGSSVMALLQENVQVDTGYDGSFVKGINGVKNTGGGISGESRDWFFYVNGVLSDVGACDYIPGEKDIVWWDYHPWKTGNFSPSLVGCYPEPFLHGFRDKKGAEVLYAEGSKEYAAQLIDSLKKQGVSQAAAKGLQDGELEKLTRPAIVLGTWQELSGFSELKNLNEAFKKTGAFAHFNGNELQLLNWRGETARTVFSGTWVIIATGRGMGDYKPVWLVAGIDDSGLQQAVEVLTKGGGKISRLYGAAVTEGNVIPLPVNS